MHLVFFIHIFSGIAITWLFNNCEKDAMIPFYYRYVIFYFIYRLNPFVLFNSMFDNIELCIDATTYGNISRFIRRSCKSNAEVSYRVDNWFVKIL